MPIAHVRVEDGEYAVLDALPAAVLVIHADGTILRANRRAAEILGRSPAQLEYLNVDTDLALDLLGACVAPRGVATDRLERPFTRPDGTQITLGCSCAPMGRDRYVVLFQDISRWHRLRDERDQLMRQAVVGEALPSILHELKNPLAAVTAAVEVLLEEVPPGSTREQLHAILTEVRRMKLGFEGVGAVGREVRAARSAAIDLACRDSFRILAVQMQAAGIHAHCDVPDLPLLPFDPSVIRALVFNLVTNAIHACRAGDTIALHARLTGSGRVFELSIVDTGSGMTREVYDRCTELFFTTKRNGSGIGLTLCHRAVVEADGDLAIETVPGVGTAVTIQLPTVGPARVAPRD